MNALFAASEHHGNGYFLPGDINEFYWGTAAFLVLVALFVWKGWKPLRNAMSGRTERIANELDEAAAAKEAALEHLDEVRSGLTNVDEEGARIRAEAAEKAQRVAADLKERAEADVAEARQRAQIEIEAMKATAMADLRAEVAARASNAAEAVVRESLDDAAQQRLIDRYIEQVGANR